jgi:hypothetical protein
MVRNLSRFFSIAAMAALGAGFASAQAGWLICTDPANTTAFSNDFGMGSPGHSPLMNVNVGEGGTWTVGNTDDTNGIECYDPSFASQTSGRFAFYIGNEGSIQTEFDQFMVLNFGSPIPGNTWGYAALNKNGNLTKFGTGGWNLFFSGGASDRYMIADTILDNARVQLYIDLIGDAVRMEWQLTNLDTVPAALTMWFGLWVAMLPEGGGDFKGWTNNGDPAFFPYITYDNGERPTILETRWTKAGDPSIFPNAFNFNYSQELPYGFRIENGPSQATTDLETGLPEENLGRANEFVLGIQGEAASGVALLGDDASDADSTFPDTTFPPRVTRPGITQSDLVYLQNPAFIQKFEPRNVGGGQTRTLVHYIRSTWALSNYAPPYSMVVDAPRIFNYDPDSPSQLSPNPARIRVWVDNTRGFSSAEKEVPLTNVRVTLNLLQTSGLKIVGGATQQTKTIARIDPRRFAFVDFDVEATSLITGTTPYSVTVQAPPGPTKTLTGEIRFTATPQVPLETGANLVAFPWEFEDTALTSVLGLDQPTDFQAFNWDPVQKGYVIATSAQRGEGTWVVLKTDPNDPNNLRPLGGNPQVPEDTAEGAGLTELNREWNLIGNPYQYPIKLGELVGVAKSSNNITFTWKEMVDSGLVNGALAWWDADSNTYRFISGINAELAPNRGYWVYIQDPSITINFPPVFLEGAETRSRSREVEETWKNSADQWKLQMVARSGEEMDDQNFLGMTTSTREANALTFFEPPMSPVQNLGLSIGKPASTGDTTGTRMAQAMSDRQSRTEWTVFVQSKTGGQVTVTWPNMATVPKNVRFTLTDPATSTTRDMRRTSGYTFEAAAGTTRELKIQIEPGGVSRALIGNVNIGRSGKDRTAPFNISYTLSGPATTTVRILGAGGKEIFTATRGRADSAGENSVIWAMKDNANRAVAPGTYRVEIVAETSDGERVRVVRPVNVVR